MLQNVVSLAIGLDFFPLKSFLSLELVQAFLDVKSSISKLAMYGGRWDMVRGLACPPVVAFLLPKLAVVRLEERRYNGVLYSSINVKSQDLSDLILHRTCVQAIG